MRNADRRRLARRAAGRCRPPEEMVASHRSRCDRPSGRMCGNVNFVRRGLGLDARGAGDVPERTGGAHARLDRPRPPVPGPVPTAPIVAVPVIPVVLVRLLEQCQHWEHPGRRLPRPCSFRLRLGRMRRQSWFRLRFSSDQSLLDPSNTVARWTSHSRPAHHYNPIHASDQCRGWAVRAWAHRAFSGCRHALWPCSPAYLQHAGVSHAESYRASSRLFPPCWALGLAVGELYRCSWGRPGVSSTAAGFTLPR